MEALDPFEAGDVAAVIRAGVRLKRDPEPFYATYGLDRDSFVQSCTVFLCSDVRDDAAKVQLLLILQEHALELFEETKRLERLFTALQALVIRDIQSMPVMLISQVLMTMTEILCVIDAATLQPRQLASIINKLFDISRMTSAPHLRVVRGVASECLHELELAYPGLLRARLPMLLQMAQDEMSNMAQSYYATLLTCVRNILYYIVRGQYVFFSAFLVLFNDFYVFLRTIRFLKAFSPSQTCHFSPSRQTPHAPPKVRFFFLI